MGYRDDFYKLENIIGYTGTVENNPTVYFIVMRERDGEDIYVFGRITQAHMQADNIGRERVYASAHYSGMNEEDDYGREVWVECIGERVIHTSRNPFVRIEDCSPRQKAVLARAISGFPEIKERYVKNGEPNHNENGDVQRMIRAWERQISRKAREAATN